MLIFVSYCANFKKELRFLNRELQLHILELADIFVERPSQYARKVEDICLYCADFKKSTISKLSKIHVILGRLKFYFFSVYFQKELKFNPLILVLSLTSIGVCVNVIVVVIKKAKTKYASRKIQSDQSYNCTYL